MRAMRALVVTMVFPLGLAWASWPRPVRTPEPVEPLQAYSDRILARPLALRCSLSRVVAERVIAVYDWADQLPVRDGSVGFTIFLPGKVPLLKAGEPCELTLMTRQTNGPVRVNLDPSQARPLFVDWLTWGSGPMRFRREGMPTAGQPDPRDEIPTLELEVSGTPEAWEVSTQLVFPVRTVPVDAPDGGVR